MPTSPNCVEREWKRARLDESERLEIKMSRRFIYLILNDSNLLAVRRREDVVEEGGFAAAEEAGEHGDGHGIAHV